MENFTPKTCGFKTEPPTLILYYELNGKGKLHRRSIPIRGLNESTRIEDIIRDLSKTHHQKYLKKVPENQLRRLLQKLHEKIYNDGKSLDSAANDDEDFNKLDDNELDKVKDKMSEGFEKNRIKPGDSNWKYDIEVDFEKEEGNKMESGWDSGESDLEF